MAVSWKKWVTVWVLAFSPCAKPSSWGKAHIGITVRETRLRFETIYFYTCKQITKHINGNLAWKREGKANCISKNEMKGRQKAEHSSTVFTVTLWEKARWIEWKLYLRGSTCLPECRNEWKHQRPGRPEWDSLKMCRWGTMNTSKGRMLGLELAGRRRRGRAERRFNGCSERGHEGSWCESRGWWG